MRKYKMGLYLLIASPALAWGSAQASGQFTIGDLPAFYQGSFGTNSNLNIFYNSTYFQYQNSTLRLKLTVPELSVSGLPNRLRKKSEIKPTCSPDLSKNEPRYSR